MQGIEVARKIQARLAELESQSSRLRQQLAETQAARARLSGERERAFLDLAEAHLPELGADGAASLRVRLPKLRRRIEGIVAEKLRERERVEQSILEAERRRRELGQELQGITSQIENKAEERDELRDAVRKDLEGNAEYSRLAQETKQANEQLLQSKRRLDAAVRDRDEKIPEYENDLLFRYLQDRRFGTHEYRGRFLNARLDGWVASLVDFRSQKQNHTLLHEVPTVMQREVTEKELHLENKRVELLAIQRSVEDRHGLTGVIAQGESLFKRRVSTVSRIEQLDASCKDLVQRRKQLDDTRGKYYERARTEYLEFLQAQSNIALRQLASSTSEASDDRVVGRIDNVESQLEQAQEEGRELQKSQHLLAERLVGGRKIESTFHRKSFDASNSTFRRGFDIDEILARFFAGGISVRGAMRAIAKSQRFKKVRQTSNASILADLVTVLAQSGLSGRGGIGGGIGGGSRRKGRSWGGFRGFGGGSGTTGGFGGGGSRTTGGFG